MPEPPESAAVSDAEVRRIRIYGHDVTVIGGPDDSAFHEVSTNGDAVGPVLTALACHVRPHAVCIDLGADFGLHTLALSLLAPEGRVLSVEPDAGAFALLEENLVRNGAENVTARRVWPAPAVDPPAPLDPELGRLPSTRSRAGAKGAPCATVDDLVDELDVGSVDVVRVSLGGAGLAVLDGAGRTLEKWRPVVFLAFDSFELALDQGMLPHVALARVRDQFPHCYVVDRTDGSIAALSTDAESTRFLYDNSARGPVDNLLCSFEPLAAPGYTLRPPVLSAGDLAGITDQLDALRAENELLRSQREDLISRGDLAWAEIEAMRRTLSWRVTSPLRSVRTRAARARAAAKLTNGPA